MRRTVQLAGLLALVALPAHANSTQLAHSVGVEPGLYSVSQMVQLRVLQDERGSQKAIRKILENPQGGDLIWRLSTREHLPSTN